MLLWFVLFLIGFTGSFLSGMLGMGGAIINYPMLLFIPPLIGAGFTPQEVAGISMAQVFFTTLAGALSYRNTSLRSKRLIVAMGLPCLGGSLLGGLGSGMISGELINLIYLLLAIAASILMFVPNKKVDESEDWRPSFSNVFAACLAFFVGLISGVVGAGGAFILIPIMLTILKIPTRITIATSLAIVFLSSIGGVVGKVLSGQILWLPTIVVVSASIIGAPLGVFLSKKTSTQSLRYLLACLILISSVKLAFEFYEQSSLFLSFK